MVSGNAVISKVFSLNNPLKTLVVKASLCSKKG